MGIIDLEPKSDRELLIMVIEQGNTTQEKVAGIERQLTILNGTVKGHSTSIAYFKGMFNGGFNGTFLPHSKIGKAGVLTGSLAIISLAAAGLKAFGDAMGWW